MFNGSLDTAKVIDVGTFVGPPFPVLDSTTYMMPNLSPTTVPPVWLFLTYEPGPVPPAYPLSSLAKMVSEVVNVWE